LRSARVSPIAMVKPGADFDDAFQRCSAMTTRRWLHVVFDV
jgi:hypothetical protein